MTTDQDALSEQNLRTLMEQLAARLGASGQMLAFAESCTGGLLSKLATDLAGSSAWFERGLVTYSNAAKQELLGVPVQVIETHGAVSEPCARAMVAGLIERAPVDWAVAVTGIAGPGGGSADKPVGTVWIAWMRRGQSAESRCFRFPGGRDKVRALTVKTSLEHLLDLISRAA